MMGNNETALVLRELAAFCDIDGEVHWKGESYREVADMIEALQEPLSVSEVYAIVGVGKSIAAKISDILQTGTCDKLFDMRKKYGELPELLSLTGIGPERARLLFTEYGISSLKIFKHFMQKGYLDEPWAAAALESLSSPTTKVPWPQANSVAAHLVTRIFGPGPYERVKVCGSLRRLKPEVKDIDIVVAEATAAERKTIKTSLRNITSSGEKLVFGTMEGVPVNIRLVPRDAFGAAVLYYTGSRRFNIRIRTRAKRRGFTKLNEYALLQGKKNMASRTEASIFKALGMEFVAPPERV